VSFLILTWTFLVVAFNVVDARWFTPSARVSKTAPTVDAFRTFAICPPPNVIAMLQQIQSLAAAHEARHLASRQDVVMPRRFILAFWYYGIMAMRKMTFSVPEPLAEQLLRRVASRDRSRFVSEAVAARLEERDVALTRACEIANQDLDVAEIEREFDGIHDEMAEPWK
jgi:Arc/MetJ-type ribon-helix-helix transcriptional regulator